MDIIIGLIVLIVILVLVLMPYIGLILTKYLTWVSKKIDKMEWKKIHKFQKEREFKRKQLLKDNPNLSLEELRLKNTGNSDINPYL